MKRAIGYFWLCLFFCGNLSAQQCEKWIVVTTIQYPTEALKLLADLPGWRLVVVADKKTPKDWHLDNCDFLSVDRQLELGYELVEHLPWNHYCRKNIGYLYAIEHGASYIYETDDDNALIAGIPDVPNLGDVVEIGSQSKVANVYAYFGQPQLWPRGFPLQKIAKGNLFSFTLPAGPLEIGVVQGLVNKDPDVDAIYRLTQGKEVYFSVAAPCILKKGVFCAYNTQNTLSVYKAFWGLYVPATTAFRVCDIWRGYMMQRLLWEVDLSLCFISASAVQERNVHDYFKDFCDEQSLYLRAGELVDFLGKWEAADATLQENFALLVDAMVEHDFFKAREAEIAAAWLRDLSRLGYTFPTQ